MTTVTSSECLAWQEDITPVCMGFRDETYEFGDHWLLANDSSELPSDGEVRWQYAEDRYLARSDDWVIDDTESPLTPATPEEAERYLRVFFKSKEMHYGGPIPESDLLCGRHIDMVLRLELSDCIDIFYASLAEHGILDDQTQVALFFLLQKETFRLSIPRHRSGGLLLVWLRLCHGWDV